MCMYVQRIAEIFEKRLFPVFMSLYEDEHVKSMQKGEYDDKILLKRSRDSAWNPAVRR